MHSVVLHTKLFGHVGIIVGKFLQFQNILNSRWPLFLPFRYATLWAINLLLEYPDLYKKKFDRKIYWIRLTFT